MKTSALAVSLLGLGFVGGCAALPAERPAAAGSRTVVEVWSGWTGREAAAFQSLADRFNQESPTVFVHIFGGVQDDTKTVRAITAGVPPDAFFLWNPGYLGPLATNGALQPLEERMTRDGPRPDEFVPASLELCRYRGRLWGLPVLIDASALYWSRSAFREAGLDPERPPRTPRELVEFARRLTRRDAHGKLTRIGFQPPDDLNPFLFASGARLADSTGAPTADTPAARKAIGWYRDVIEAMGGEEPVSAFTAGFGQTQSPNHPFFRGQCAMMVSGEWLPYWVQRWAPSLDYGVAAFPSASPQVSSGTVIGGNVLCLPRAARHPDEAWTFIRWLQRADVQRDFARSIYNLPNRKDLLTDPTLTAGSRAAEGYSVLFHLAAGPGARSFPNLPLANVLQAELGNARDFVAHREKPVEAALADVQRRLDREAAASARGGGS